MSQGRLFELVYLLLERGRMTAPELAEHFEVSVRTIYRDVDALSAAGVPIYAARGKGGGVALMEHFVLSRATFSEAEQQQLLTALQSLAGEARLGASEILSKLSALFHRQEPDWLQVNLSRWGAAGGDAARFESLKTAILSRKIISFTYVSSYGQTTRRRVLPARLVFKGQAWYLQGFCLEKEAYRTFKVSRMLALKALEENFDRPLAPPPIEGDSPVCPWAVPVRMRFSPALAYRVYDDFDESCVTREADGSLLVEVSFPEDQWLYGYLLSFGLGVEVLSPANLRRRLGMLAGEISRSCAKPDTGCQESRDTIESSQTKEVFFMDQPRTFCQSCGMPIDDPALHGSEADGAPSPHYCKYCYQKGAFTSGMTMEEMIDFCTPMMVQANPGMTPQQAREQMHQFFPLLLRWKK